MREDAITFEALRCRHCGTLDTGPRELCPNCHSADLDPCALDGKGVLVSWTTIRRAPARFRSQAPYTVAVVDLDSGLRICGRLLRDPGGLALGTPVVAVGGDSGAYLFERAGG